MQESLMGAAKANKMLGDPDKAHQFYERLAKESPPSPLTREAEARLKALDDPNTKKEIDTRSPPNSSRPRRPSERPRLVRVMEPTPALPDAEGRIVELTAKCRMDDTRLDQYLAGVVPRPEPIRGAARHRRRRRLGQRQADQGQLQRPPRRPHPRHAAGADPP